jgi:MFS family permease
MKAITRTVWILSLVSLLTDTASEMLYPVMPLYLKSIGFSVILIGVLEGLAEATAGLSKGYFGQLSDQRSTRMPFVQWGYGLSAISKPLLAFFVYPVWIFFARTVDRLGKGLRTGARDAVLSDEATPATKGRVFGFHRSMDTLGAVIGPLSALLYLRWHPHDYKPLFILAFIPGVLAVWCSLLLKDKNKKSTTGTRKISFFSFLNYWKHSPVLYKKLVIGLLVFALFNSSDVFLLLKAKQVGLTDIQVITVYIFYNLVYAAFAFPIGVMADNIGLKSIFLIGLLLFAVVYIGMAFIQIQYLFYVLFFLYGIYAAATEGVSKAWITNITDRKDTATAIGTYAGFQSICAMLASSLAGVIWFGFGSTATFLISAMAVLAVVAYVSFIPFKKAP